MKLSDYPQLKKEILGLPAKERDKLLLRLVAKDKVLTERMHFLLMEGEAGLADRIQDLREVLQRLKDVATAYELSDAGSLLKILRYGMKLINHFYKVTKSKFDMLELKLYFLNIFNLGALRPVLLRSKVKHELLFKFLIKTTLSLHKIIQSLHADLQYDLAEAGDLWLGRLQEYAPSGLAKDLRLIKNWS